MVRGHFVTGQGQPSWGASWTKDNSVWDSTDETPYHSWRRGVIPKKGPKSSRASGDLAAIDNLEFETFVEALVRTLSSVTDQMPESARNPDPDAVEHWWPAADLRAEAPPPKTPIVGIIDDGIALSHSQFRSAGGGTRILASWQQSERWGTASGLADLPSDITQQLPGFDAKQISLPAGSELYQHDIDALVAAHTTNGQVDEDRFNRASGLIDMTTETGQRTLAFREAHGTHVADIAGGNSDYGLMFVNLPSRRQVGLSGTFIEKLLLLGVLRIITWADKLWDQAGYSVGNDAVNGYPIVINMSFSKMAGGRDVITPLAYILKLVNELREASNRSKVHFVFPTGNDNLLEGVGQFTLQSGESKTFEVDVPPEDQSSSYLEMWTRSPAIGWVGGLPPLEIALSGPGGLAQSGQLSRGTDGQFRDLKKGSVTLARLFSSDAEEGKIMRFIGLSPQQKSHDLTVPSSQSSAAGGGFRRQRYLLALRPTLSCDAAEMECPAGRWSFTLRNASGDEQKVTVAVQSDQSALPAGTTSRRPKLVDEFYERFTTNGRIRDSYDPVTGDYTDTPADPKNPGYVLRHGTVSALAAASLYSTRTSSPNNRSVFLAAGYRASDSVPANYSSTGFQTDNPEHSFAPNAAFPTDDAATLFGILASGANEGSKVAYRGTSFAAAQATRLIASLLADHGNGFGTDVISKIECAAKNQEGKAQKPDMQAKIGYGRHPKVGPSAKLDRL